MLPNLSRLTMDDVGGEGTEEKRCLPPEEDSGSILVELDSNILNLVQRLLDGGSMCQDMAIFCKMLSKEFSKGVCNDAAVWKDIFERCGWDFVLKGDEDVEQLKEKFFEICKKNYVPVIISNVQPKDWQTELLHVLKSKAVPNGTKFALLKDGAPDQRPALEEIQTTLQGTYQVEVVKWPDPMTPAGFTPTEALHLIRKLHYSQFSLFLVRVKEDATELTERSCLPIRCLPPNIETIGNHAFSCCQLLPLEFFPTSLTSIGEYAFSSCRSITPNELPESVNSIGPHAFRNCKNVTFTSLPKELTQVSSHSFYECESMPMRRLGDEVSIIGEFAFFRCESLNLGAFPSKLKEIHTSAFYECKSLIEVELPNVFSFMGRRAFFKCKSLETVYLSNTIIEIIPEDAFYECTKLKSLTLPNTLIEIKENAFYKCALTRTQLPESLKQIHSSAFALCSLDPQFEEELRAIKGRQMDTS